MKGPQPRRTAFASRSHSERTFLACLFPTATFHNHSHHHPHGLPQTLGSPGMLRCQELVYFATRFKLAHHARQWRTCVMNLGFLHPPLSIGVVKKDQNPIKWLQRIVRHVGKRAPLAIVEE